MTEAAADAADVHDQERAMLFPNPDGGAPSLLVEDGETVTLSTSAAEADGLTAVRLRPRSTVALLRACGIAAGPPPRLSDPEAFERVDELDGLVDLSRADDAGRIGGLSPLAVRSILSVLDSGRPMPSSFSWPPVSGATREQPTLMEQASPDVGRMTLRLPVPGFIRDLAVHVIALLFQDIVIGHGSTLVIGRDLNHLCARNILAYNGARIVQQSNFVTVDVTGRLRGGLLALSHRVADSDHLEILFDRIDAMPVVLP